MKKIQSMLFHSIKKSNWFENIDPFLSIANVYCYFLLTPSHIENIVYALEYVTNSSEKFFFLIHFFPSRHSIDEQREAKLIEISN